MTSLKYPICICILIAALLFPLTGVSGTEMSIPARHARPGNSVEIPVMIDAADGLAAVKLSMAYDKNLLKFKHAAKSGQSASMLHIVNDKKPGTLIVVMASAMGITGKKIPLILLTFGVAENVNRDQTTQIEITKVQLMNDNLEYINCNTRTNPITISIINDQSTPNP